MRGLAMLLALACGAACKARPPPRPDARCELDGRYRLRFPYEGRNDPWLRFRVAGGGARAGGVVEDRVSALDIAANAPVEVTADAKACTLVALVHGAEGRVARATLELDSASGEVRGTLAIDEKRESPIFGVRERERDDAKRAALGRCPKPGIYEVTIDPNVEWESERSEDEGGFCFYGMQIDHALLRVGRLGGRIIVDGVNTSGDADPDQASEPAGAVEDVKPEGECGVTFTYSASLLSFDATLVFAGGAAVGVERDAAYQMIEDGEDGENLWLCKAPRAMLTGRWVRE